MFLMFYAKVNAMRVKDINIKIKLLSYEKNIQKCIYGKYIKTSIILRWEALSKQDTKLRTHKEKDLPIDTQKASVSPKST